MFEHPFYPGLADGLDLQAEVKSDVLDSVVVGSENSSALQGQCQDIQISRRESFEVSRLPCGALCRLSRLGGWTLHAGVEDGKQGFGPNIFQLRFYSRDCYQIAGRPLAPDEYRSIRYDIHMQRLLKVIVLGLFPDQNAIIV